VRLPSGKFCSARAVWMPHKASDGKASAPRLSVSVRVGWGRSTLRSMAGLAKRSPGL